MSAEIESAGTWLDAAFKGMSVLVTALFGWVWRTSHRQATLEQKMDAADDRLERIEKGVGRILNHLTGTNLHDE